MKLLVDMNLSPHWVPLLVKAGMQARHWSEVGKPVASDLEIFDYAALNDYVILTYDLDFGAILAVGRGKKPSVAQIRSGDVSAEEVAIQVIRALFLMKADLEAGALLTIEADRTRLRVLPLLGEE
jgi:predicted nuclease of predicted toxin-antitoxin system